jgi:hypothetical protein
VLVAEDGDQEPSTSGREKLLRIAELLTMFRRVPENEGPSAPSSPRAQLTDDTVEIAVLCDSHGVEPAHGAQGTTPSVEDA